VLDENRRTGFTAMVSHRQARREQTDLSLSGQLVRSTSTLFSSVWAPTAAASDSLAIRQDLQRARIRRNLPYTHSQLNEFTKASSFLPTSTYAALCPVRALPLSRCGVSESELPCPTSPLIQSMFGNSVDLAVRRSNDNSKGDQGAVSQGVGLGYDTLDSAGWVSVDTPAALEGSSSELSKAHVQRTFDMFGLKTVARKGECEEFLLFSVHKKTVPGTVSAVKQQLKSMQQIDHISVLKLIEICECRDDIYLIYEACGGAGVLPMMTYTEGRVLPTKSSAQVCQQLASAIAYCNKFGLHMVDWSLWNVMSDSESSPLEVKLFGVGLAGALLDGKQLGMDKAAWLERESFHFMSPEVCAIKLALGAANPYQTISRDQCRFTDVWGIGSVMYTLLAGHHPFLGASEHAVMTITQGSTIVFDAEFVNVEPAGIALLESMLSKNGSKRPNADSLVRNAWVISHVRAMNGKHDMANFVDRLKNYAQMKPGMRCLSFLLKQKLSHQSVVAIEEAFRCLDLNGNGEVGPEELAVWVTEKREDIKEIFSALDADGTGTLTIQEFLLASTLADEVLSEKMLVDVFHALDADGTGSVTAVELYRKLKTFNTGLTPAELLDFMGDLDRNWDADIDYEEFKSYFPAVSSTTEVCQQRFLHADALARATCTTFHRFSAECSTWMEKVKEQKRAAKAVEVLANDESTGGSKETCRAFVGVIRHALHLIRNPPELKFDQDATDALDNHLAFQAQTEVADKKSHSWLRGQQKLSGLHSLNAFFRHSKDVWLDKIAALMKRASFVSGERSKTMRRTEILLILDDFLFWEDIIIFCDQHIEEQKELLEVSQPEERLPSFARTMHGLTSISQDVDLDVENYRQKRSAALESKQRQLERAHCQQGQQQRTCRRGVVEDSATQAEIRGHAWAARHAMKAARHTKRLYIY